MNRAQEAGQLLAIGIAFGLFIAGVSAAGYVSLVAQGQKPRAKRWFVEVWLTALAAAALFALSQRVANYQLVNAFSLTLQGRFSVLSMVLAALGAFGSLACLVRLFPLVREGVGSRAYPPLSELNSRDSGTPDEAGDRTCGSCNSEERDSGT